MEYAHTDLFIWILYIFVFTNDLPVSDLRGPDDIKSKWYIILQQILNIV